MVDSEGPEQPRCTNYGVLLRAGNNKESGTDGGRDCAVAVTARFAPSPTGYMHLGHAYSALVAWSAAQDAQGKFRLRIEDIEQNRCRSEFEDGIYDDLRWLGISWEGPVLRQSNRHSAYADGLEKLARLGVIYPCFCTSETVRTEITNAYSAPHGVSGPHYPGTCRNLKRGEQNQRIRSGQAHALRLDVAKAQALAGPLVWHDRKAGTAPADAAVIGDVVLARADVPTGYHLAVTIDDNAQGVTLVCRGDDLLPFTHIHRLLQALLGLRTPEYHHHPLITDADGKRLSKRSRAVTLRALRGAGKSPTEVRGMIGFE